MVRHYGFKDYKSSKTCQNLVSITDSHRDLIAKLKFNCTSQCVKLVITTYRILTEQYDAVIRFHIYEGLSDFFLLSVYSIVWSRKRFLANE